MRFYLYYAQTPELQSISSLVERESVHAQAWRQLRSRRPALFLRSIAIVMLFVFVGGVTTDTLSDWLTLPQAPSFAPWGAAIGGAIAALLHTHAMATSLRPVYAEVIAQRRNTAG